MCDGDHRAGTGWKGWRALPPQQPWMPKGPWRDLTYPLGPDVPRATVFPQPEFRRLKSLPADPLNVTEMQMVVHIGTHVDAPRHFFADGPAFHDIALERLCGPGVVLRVARGAGEAIGVADLQAQQALVQPGDIVAIDTGWSRYAGTPQYHDHPYLDVEAARWLVERGVKLAAFDVPTPDLPLARRPAGYDWPAHHVLLGHGVLVSENVYGLGELAGQRVEFAFMALNIVDSDGAPARVMARPVQAGGMAA
ncbi:cyclase family protein [Bordetella petrii]|uniref:cyclase family protein n=1 Tax=Bordetella petrii TaxID=94624 RepID=UPI0004B75DAA|nr:cyclase family protein [Bordetella petrii]